LSVRYSVIAAIVSVVWAVIAVVGMTYGTTYNWPDYVHVNYGIPLVFATHTLDTIAGPVDKWSLDLGSLAVNLTFWLAGMVIILLIVVYLEGSSSRRRGSPS
jgi:hypothetical protein